MLNHHRLGFCACDWFLTPVFPLARGIFQNAQWHDLDVCVGSVHPARQGVAEGHLSFEFLSPKALGQQSGLGFVGACRRVHSVVAVLVGADTERSKEGAQIGTAEPAWQGRGQRRAAQRRAAVRWRLHSFWDGG